MLGININSDLTDSSPRKLYYKGDYDAMNTYFCSINWILLMRNFDVQNSVDLFYDYVNVAVERLFLFGQNKYLKNGLIEMLIGG